MPPIDVCANREGADTRDYSVFGGRLRSEIDFPELSLATDQATPDWSVIVEHTAPPTEKSVLLGERCIREERYQLSCIPNGLRLVYSHAGTFDIAGDGSSIRWYYQADALPELVRNIIIGPAISLALELAGFLCLHGSAVAIDDSAVAFVGPKYFGKSTLATALTAAGARLIGDDLLVVSAGPPANVRPGVASVRLWSDMTTALPLGAICNTLIPGVKTTATGFAEQAVAIEPASLRAIYVLSPVPAAGDVPTVLRRRLSPSEATVALAHQTKVPPSLVGLRAAGSQLAASADVAATVPVWTLQVIRDVAKLPALVSQIIEWSSTE
jgi:hypothetical protein